MERGGEVGVGGRLAQASSSSLCSGCMFPPAGVCSLAGLLSRRGTKCRAQARCGGSSFRGPTTTHLGPSPLHGPRRVQRGSPARRPRPGRPGAGTSSHRDPGRERSRAGVGEVGAGPGRAAAARESGSGRRSGPGGPGRHVAPLEAREGGQSIFLCPRVGRGAPARRVGEALGSCAPGPRPGARGRRVCPPPGLAAAPARGRAVSSCRREIRPEIRTGEALGQLLCLRSDEL